MLALLPLMGEQPPHHVRVVSEGLAPGVLGYLLHLLVGEKYGGRCEWDEIGLPVAETGLTLPCGATGRWMAE